MTCSFDAHINKNTRIQRELCHKSFLGKVRLHRFTSNSHLLDFFALQLVLIEFNLICCRMQR